MRRSLGQGPCLLALTLFSADAAANTGRARWQMHFWHVGPPRRRPDTPSRTGSAQAAGMEGTVSGGVRKRGGVATGGACSALHSYTCLLSFSPDSRGPPPPPWWPLGSMRISTSHTVKVNTHFSFTFLNVSRVGWHTMCFSISTPYNGINPLILRLTCHRANLLHYHGLYSLQ